MKKIPVSKTRRIYIARLILRCAVLVICTVLILFRPDMFDILKGNGFFKELSPFHLLWTVWMLDMLSQLIPIGRHVSLGSEKMFLKRFKPIYKKINSAALKKHIISTTKTAYKVFLLWTALLAVIGALYYRGILDDKVLFMITTIFYVCDLVCVLIWCPFRLIMKNRCCTTCRIFNWDHLMMFTPMMFTDGFFPRSLVYMSIIVFIMWELCVLIYPERFWEKSNMALKCSECTDKLCTQYCRKLRR